MRRMLAALLFAAACAPPPSTLHTEVTLPAGFSQSGSSQLPDRWWLAFDDPALAKLVDQALAGNLDLRIAWTRLAQAQAVARGADAAARPTVDASVNGGVSTRVGSTSSVDESISGSLSASYELDLWGRVQASRDAATYSEQATAEDVQAAAISLTGEIATTYYQLVQARAADALLSDQITESEQTLGLVQKRVTAGLAPLDDQLRQEQSLEALHGSRSVAAGQISNLQHQLAVLVGRPPTASIAPDGATLAELPPLPATGVPSELLKRRPDVIAAYLRVEASDRDVAAAIAARYPRVTISAKTSIDAPFTGWLASLVAGLTQPLYDGGKLAADEDRAKAQLAESVLSYQATVLSAAQEVEDALVTEQRGRENLDSLDRQLALSQQTLSAEEQRYTAGLSDYLGVLSAEASVQGLQRQRLSAEGDLLSNRIALYRALAGEWGLAAPKA